MCSINSWINCTKLMSRWRKKRRPRPFASYFAFDSYDNMVRMLLFEKDRAILEDVTTPLLSNEIRRKPNLKGGQIFLLVVRVQNCKER